MKVCASVLLCLLMIQNVKGTTELASILEDHWNWFLEEFPEYATHYGDNRWNNKLQSYNITVYPKRKETVEGFLNRLNAVDDRQLTVKERQNKDILDNVLTTYVDGFRWFKYGAINPLNFLEGPQMDAEWMMKDFPFHELQDFNKYLERISATKIQIEEIIELFREAIRLRRTLSSVTINRVIDQLDSMLSQNATDFILFKPFRGKLSNWSIPVTAKSDLRTRAIRIIQDDYMGSFERLRNFLQTEYLPNTRQDWGVSSWDPDYYESCLKWHLSVEVTAQYVHNLGTNEVDRISREMKSIMNKKGHGGMSISEYFDFLKASGNFQMSSPEEILQAYTDMIFNRINPRLPSIFSDIPDLPVEVRSDPFGGAGSYSAAAADGSRPGIFWTSTLIPNETLSFDMMALTAHEVNPGHHFQISYSLKEDLPPFRKYVPYIIYSAPFNFPAFTAFGEGWALYAEFLVQELNLYKDDNELMGRYSSEIFRACRLVVDTCIHAFGWSRERAIGYMLNYTSLSRNEISREIDRYITWPGQACAYKFGELKIRQMREKAERQLGELFDIKKFHSTVLDVGRAPLYLTEKAVDQMIQDSASGQSTCFTQCYFSNTQCMITMGLALIPVFMG